jgi:hypothetical protein
MKMLSEVHLTFMKFARDIVQEQAFLDGIPAAAISAARQVFVEIVGAFLPRILHNRGSGTLADYQPLSAGEAASENSTNKRHRDTGFFYLESRFRLNPGEQPASKTLRFLMLKIAFELISVREIEIEQRLSPVSQLLSDLTCLNLLILSTGG